MGHVIVAGNAGIDRIWRLDAPLRPGARITCTALEQRYGGGGYLTGIALIALGHGVTFATRLPTDAMGEAQRAYLKTCGFDLHYVAATGQATAAVDILVEPSGERTLITRAGQQRLPIERLPDCEADAIYVNLKTMPDEMVAQLADRPLCVAQFPLAPAEKRPADVMLASRSDVGPKAPADLFADAETIAGSRLKTLFVTDGGSDIVTASRSTSWRTSAEPVKGLRLTIGAGDFFAAGVIDGLLRQTPVAQIAAHAARIAAHFLQAFDTPPKESDGAIEGPDPQAIRPAFLANL